MTWGDRSLLSQAVIPGVLKAVSMGDKYLQNPKAGSIRKAPGCPPGEDQGVMLVVVTDKMQAFPIPKTVKK